MNSPADADRPASCRPRDCASGVLLHPAERTDHERDVAAAGDGLGVGALTVTWAEGRAMPPRQAVA